MQACSDIILNVRQTDTYQHHLRALFIELLLIAIANAADRWN